MLDSALSLRSFPMQASRHFQWCLRGLRCRIELFNREMIADSISFRGHRCFKTEWAGFDSVKPINVIIGRNNTGKSHLLDLAEALCASQFTFRDWEFRCSGTLDEVSLRSVFDPAVSGGPLQGEHWKDHGIKFRDATVTWELDKHGNHTSLSFPDGFEPESPYGPNSTHARLGNIRAVTAKARHKLSDSVFR